MKIMRFLCISLLAMFLCSVLPYNLTACYFVPICDSETKAALEATYNTTREALETAEQEQNELEELNAVARLIMIGEVLIRDSETDPTENQIDNLNKAMAESNRRDVERAAQKKVDDAQKVYDAAREAYNACRDVYYHAKYLPACGNQDHRVNMCELMDPQLWGDAYRARFHMTHDRRQASCRSESSGDTCSVTGFYFCQDHTHQFTCGYNHSFRAAGCGDPYTVNNRSAHQVKRCSNCSNYYKNCSITTTCSGSSRGHSFHIETSF